MPRGADDERTGFPTEETERSNANTNVGVGAKL